ncbi:MAG TPA: hypothetical protein PLL78_06500 [Fimbriimonadaceae bacterium]|nr:hypothetical protein [Fimbriimonadaceae bacterium]HRJ96318.1 hypothetical protein [Fimbriimonadaceae bacterium]
MRILVSLAALVAAHSSQAQGYRVLDIQGNRSNNARYAVLGNLHYYPASGTVSRPSAFYFKDQERTNLNQLGVHYLWFGPANTYYSTWLSSDRKRFHIEGIGYQKKRVINRQNRQETMTITGRLVVDLYNDVNGRDRMVCSFTPDRNHPNAGYATPGLIFDASMPSGPMSFRFRN